MDNLIKYNVGFQCTKNYIVCKIVIKYIGMVKEYVFISSFLSTNIQSEWVNSLVPG